VRPAINVGLSVSRVGGSAQTKAMKRVSGTLKLDLAQFRELEAFSQFASDLDADTRKQLERGKRMVEILKQGTNEPIPFEKQVALIYAGTVGALDALDISEIKAFEKDLYLALDKEEKTLQTIRDTKDLNEESKALLNTVFKSIK
jgi:F-type H+-transporting ATPase subunit alpha